MQNRRFKANSSSKPNRHALAKFDGGKHRQRANLLIQFGLMAVALLPMVACSVGQSAASSESGSSSKAGVLKYSGDYNGEVTFKDSDCNVMDGHLLAFNAPHEKGGVPSSMGMNLAITFEKSGAPMQAVFALDDGATQDNFMRVSQNKPIHGVAARKKNDQWQVEFQGLELADTNFLVGAADLKGMAASKQKTVVLNGVLHCTGVQ